MSDIVERLKEPELHYPGNFDTPKRANAMLSCLCQEAKEEIESLRQQLAASQLQNMKLREALMYLQSGLNARGETVMLLTSKIRQALALPQDTSALEAIIAKAGEVMRERCATVRGKYGERLDLNHERQIRGALPGVTLEDIK